MRGQIHMGIGIVVGVTKVEVVLDPEYILHLPNQTPPLMQKQKGYVFVLKDATSLAEV
jgi:hypothetical protein